MYCLISLLLSIPWITVSITYNHLSSKLGLNGTALDWFRSYLSGRSQQVSIRGAYLISLTCDMAFLKARALFYFSLQFMQAHCLMSSKSTSQLFIVIPMTLTETSRLVPRRTLPRLMELLLSNVFYPTGFCRVSFIRGLKFIFLD